MIIKAKYDTIQVVGNYLIYQAKEILNEKAILDKKIDEVRNSWSGMDAEQFISKSLTYSNELTKVAETLNNMGTLIRVKGSNYQAISEDFIKRMRSL